MNGWPLQTSREHGRNLQVCHNSVVSQHLRTLVFYILKKYRLPKFLWPAKIIINLYDRTRLLPFFKLMNFGVDYENCAWLIHESV